MRAQFVLQEVWTGLRRNLTMTIALVVVVAISLALLGTGLLFVKQVDNTRTYWQGKVQLSIYLCTSTSVSPQCRQNGPTTAAQKAQILHDLKSLPQVQQVFFESQAQAFQHFRQDFSRDPSFTSLVTESEIRQAREQQEERQHCSQRRQQHPPRRQTPEPHQRSDRNRRT